MYDDRWKQLCARPAIPHAFSARLLAHEQSRLLHEISEKVWAERVSLGHKHARRRRRLDSINGGALWLAAMLIPDPRVKEPSP
jgi:hypothetical protein